MMAKIEFDGFDEVMKELEHLQHNVEELSRIEELNFGELFNSEFMSQYTRFKTIDELFAAGGFTIGDENNLDSIPKDKLDDHIAATTKFSSWEEMASTAFDIYASKKIAD
jgi:hypothetical protein